MENESRQKKLVYEYGKRDEERHCGLEHRAIDEVDIEAKEGLNSSSRTMVPVNQRFAKHLKRNFSSDRRFRMGEWKEYK